MILTFLGTSAMVPTKERNVAAIFLEYSGEGILFDCGEGTQRQMNIAGIKRSRVTRILVSHWHGDHVSGIIGLVQTMGSDCSDEKPPEVLHIYGPKETKKRFEHMMQTCIFDQRIQIEVHELIPKDNKVLRFFENEDFVMECAELDHKVPCIGFNFILKDKINIDTVKLNKAGIGEGPHLRKLKDGKNIEWKGKKINYKDVTYLKQGKKITYISDTVVCEGAIALAKDADILISESVYTSEHEEKAEQYKHMTAKSAALLANKAEVKKLVLTHFSQRYKNSQDIEEDARTYFDNIVCAFDFMKLKV